VAIKSAARMPSVHFQKRFIVSYSTSLAGVYLKLALDKTVSNPVVVSLPVRVAQRNTQRTADE
jgi:hypothetical protein